MQPFVLSPAHLLLLAAWAFSAVSALPSSWLDILSKRQAPNDAWYSPPAGWASNTNGYVLKYRGIGTTVINTNFVARTVTATEVMYKTQDVNQNAIWSVTTVFVPYAPWWNRLISFQTPYDSAYSSCEPSIQFSSNASQLTVFDQTKILTFEAYLGNGWIVSVPDYEGQDAAFGAGRLAGTGTLDSMRAAGKWANTYASPLRADQNPPWVGIGYSGGSIATGWAAGLQPTYAPDLTVKAWIIGGTPANITAAIQALDGGPTSGFGPIGIAGLSKQSSYKSTLDPFFSGKLTATGQTSINKANSLCNSDALGAFQNQKIQALSWSSYGDRLLYQSTLNNILAQQTMGVKATEKPTVPVYMYHAIVDEIVPFEPAKTLYKTWCAQGVSINFTSYAAGGHITTAIVGLGGTIDFTKRAFGTITGGPALPSGCTNTTTATTTLDKAVLGVSESLFTALAQAQQSAGAT